MSEKIQQNDPNIPDPSKTESQGSQDPDIGGQDLDKGSQDVDKPGQDLDSVTYYKPISNPLVAHSQKVPLAQSENILDRVKSYTFFDFIRSPESQKLVSDQENQDFNRNSSIPDKSDDIRVDAEGSNLVTPIIDDMEESLVDVLDEWPDIDSLDYLHKLNVAYRSTRIGKLVHEDDVARAKFHCDIVALSASILSSIPAETQAELYYYKDEDDVLETLVPRVRETVAKVRAHEGIQARRCFYLCTLGFLCGVFMRQNLGRDYFSHGFMDFTGDIYRMSLPVFGLAEELGKRMIEKEDQELAARYAHPDQHKESDASLTAIEKARVFRNGLNTMNQIGWISFEKIRVTGQIHVRDKKGLADIERIFELNPDLTPRGLLDVMEKAMEIRLGRPLPSDTYQKGRQWHARRANSLRIFTKNLHDVINQVHYWPPGLHTFLHEAEEELLPGH